MKTLLHSAFPISSVGLVARKVGRSRIWGILALGLAMSGIALGQSMELVGLSVAGRGPHHTVWQRVQRLVDGSGNSVLFTNRWTELATGLNFFDSKAGDWTETRQAFDISPEGYAIAARGQHRVILAADINDGGSVDLDMPDGKRLVSNPMGLSYVDTASGKNVLLAEVTNCIGQLVAANVVLYPAAFDTLKAALRMTYSQSGFEQDVLLLENPGSPADYGLAAR